MNPSEGNICGANDYEDKPYLFYFDATKCFEPSLPGEECPGTTKLCVSECPDQFSSVYTSLADADKLADLTAEILWYANELGVEDDNGLKVAVEAVKFANDGEPIPAPETFFCVRQSWASVKEAAKTLAGFAEAAAEGADLEDLKEDAFDAGKKLQELIDQGDCNMYTIPSAVS